jgi:hypothetical protein
MWTAIVALYGDKRWADRVVEEAKQARARLMAKPGAAAPAVQLK